MTSGRDASISNVCLGPMTLPMTMPSASVYERKRSPARFYAVLVCFYASDLHVHRGVANRASFALEWAFRCDTRVTYDDSHERPRN